MQFIDLKKQYSILEKEINSNIESILNEGRYIGGSEVKQLENELAEYCGVKYCLTCAN
ncbi:MAG: DegT/DnrJ/EryC1/StrS family aminotransferase, partial [Clostridia bacterium]